MLKKIKNLHLTNENVVETKGSVITDYLTMTVEFP